MNTLDALKDMFGLRITHEDRWMIWDMAEEAWIVYQRKHRAKNTKVLIQTEDEEKAVKILLGKDD